MVYGVVIGTLLLIFSKTIINTWGRGRGVGSILVDWRGKSLFHLAVFRGHNHTKHFAVYMSNIELLPCTHYIAIIRAIRRNMAFGYIAGTGFVSTLV